MYQIKEIKKSFVKKIRFPELENDLKDKTRKLAEIIHNWNSNKQEVLKILSQIKAILKNIKYKYKDKELQKSISIILEKLKGKKNFKKLDFTKMTSNLNEEEIWDIYNDIVEIEGIMEQSIKDIKWENND